MAKQKQSRLEKRIKWQEELIKRIQSEIDLTYTKFYEEIEEVEDSAWEEVVIDALKAVGLNAQDNYTDAISLLDKGEV